MAMSASQFEDMANPMSQQGGQASGSLVNAFGAMYEPFAGSGISALHYAYFDFSNNSDFSGEAQGTGLGAKLGFTYQVDNSLTLGATYHAKTQLSDLESDNAQLSMGVTIDTGIASGGSATGTYVDNTIPLSGKITVEDFQWPAMLALGATKRIGADWLIALDFKRIQWSDVLEDFTMTFEADNVASNGGFAGATMTASLYQHWQDQDVISLGTSYQASTELTLRAGANFADNPIPNRYLNALFPAITENHYTAGASYLLSDSQSIHFAASYAPEVSFTSAGGITSSHSQLNWQLMYSRHWY